MTLSAFQQQSQPNKVMRGKRGRKISLFFQSGRFEMGKETLHCFEKQVGELQLTETNRICKIVPELCMNKVLKEIPIPLHLIP